MAKLNVPRKQIFTREGAVAKTISTELQLRRSVMSCMLWEKEFYEDGVSIAQRIADLVPLVDATIVAAIAIEARTKGKLRHVPLWIVRAMSTLSEHKKLVAETLAEVIQRPDELSEFLSIYWKTNSGRKVISAQVKKGLAKAFTKFNAYSLAKWNRDGAIKLRDVLFLSHAKPKDDEQAELWKQLINNTLPTPDTWEVELSASKNKTESWTRLLIEQKLPALALLRNLRNIQQADVPQELVKSAILNMRTERVLPFRFIAAARYAPELEPELEVAMLKSIEGKEKLGGKTVLLIDVSGSMNSLISHKSEMKRLDAACGLAVLARELSSDIKIYTFSHKTVLVPPRRGFALRDAIVTSQPHGGTYLGDAIRSIPRGFDRLIVFTDEQSHDSVTNPFPEAKCYMVNVASAKNGVGYHEWAHIDGFSEAILDYIQEYEKF